MSAPLVSVVIPNYNYARFLPEAIDSVLAQTYEPVEIVVVDDGSTDESLQVLERYRRAVRVIAQKNRGVSAARNVGIAESKGSLIAFLDADDAWLPEKLAEQVELLRGDDVGMVYTGLRYVDERGKSLGTMVAGGRGRVLEQIVLNRDPGVPASGSSALVPRTTFETVGGFDESLSTSADWDMWRRIACRYAIELARSPLVLYRQHDRAMHANVGVLERDMLRALGAAFADPAAASVHHLERRAYGNLYLTLAGSYLHAGNVGASMRSVAAAVRAWPPGIGYVLATPVRLLARTMGVGWSPRSVGRSPRARSLDA